MTNQEIETKMTNECGRMIAGAKLPKGALKLVDSILNRHSIDADHHTKLFDRALIVAHKINPSLVNFGIRNPLSA